MSAREKVKELHARGMTGRDIAKALGITPPTVAYHLRRLGVAAQPYRRYDWAGIQAYYDAGHSVRDCLAHLGCSGQTWHAARRRGDVVTRPQRMTIAELTSRPSHRGNVKRRLLEEGLLVAECAWCADSWGGRNRRVGREAA